MGSGSASVSLWNGPPGTLGSIAAEVTRHLKGDMQNAEGQAIIRDYINDAVSKFWLQAIKVKLARFVGSASPVTLQFGSGVERVRLVANADPVFTPTLTTSTGGQLLTRRIQVAISLVTESGAQTNITPIAIQNVLTGQLLNVASPTPSQVAASTGNGLVGYNVYAGQSQMGLQNQQPVPFTTAWIEPINGGVQDYPAAQQLPPTENSTYDTLAYITHMEMQLPDGTWQAQNQNDIDSMVMRQLSRVYPNASQYQNFSWDILNGNVVEIRPVTGIAITNRYWYIQKPLRIRYDQGKLPYTSIQGTYEFYRSYAIMMAKLDLEEYLAFQAWQQVVQDQGSAVIEALNQENWALDTRVTPYMR